MWKAHKKWDNEHGFTLIELVVTFIILGIISTIAIGILDTNTKTYSEVFYRSYLLTEGRNALRVIRNDIQNMNRETLSILEAGHMKFDDVDGNSIEYELSSASLLRNSQPLLNHLSNPDVFVYLDKNQDTTNVAQNVRFIRVNLKLTRNNFEIEMGEKIYVRN